MLTSQALDKNYIDSTNDSLISIATDYFRTKEVSSDRMKSFYYSGIVHKNAGDYPRAILDFEIAEKDAHALRDPFYLGLIHRNQAEVFSLVLNNPYAIEYRKKAVEAFRQSGKERYLQSALLSLAIDYTNAQDYESAKDILRQLEEHTISDPLRLDCLLLEASIAVEEGGTENAVELYRSLPPDCFSIIDYEYYGYALLDTGYSTEAQAVFQAIDDIDLDAATKANIYSIQSHFLANNGEYEESYRLLKQSKIIQDSVVRIVLQQSLGAVQRDYYKAELQLQEQKKESQKQRTWFILIASSVLFVSAIIYFINQERKKKKQQEELMALLDEQAIELSSMRNTNANLVGSLFRVTWTFGVMDFMLKDKGGHFG